jgi:excisionase family DNA binding protein
MTRLLTMEEFARATGLEARHSSPKVWRRELDFVKLGRSIRFREETLSRLIEDSTVPALETR